LGALRADERFSICGTFKPIAAAAVPARVGAGREQLARRIRGADRRQNQFVHRHCRHPLFAPGQMAASPRS